MNYRTDKQALYIVHFSLSHTGRKAYNVGKQKGDALHLHLFRVFM